MVSFVDEDDVRVAKRPGHVAGPFPLPLKVSMVVSDETNEAAVQVRQKSLDNRFPNVLAGGFRREQDDALRLMHHESLDEHQADVGFTESNAIAKKSATVAASDLNEVFVSVALILREELENDGLLLVPLVRSQFMPAAKLVQRLEPDLERGARLRVALDRPEDVGRNVLGLIPVTLIPIL